MLIQGVIWTAWPVPCPAHNNSNRFSVFQQVSAPLTKLRAQFDKTLYTYWTESRYLFQNNLILNVHETRTEHRKEIGICFPYKSGESKHSTIILPLTFDLLLQIFHLQSLAFFFNNLFCSSSMKSSQLVLACKSWSKYFSKFSRPSLFEYFFL